MTLLGAEVVGTEIAANAERIEWGDSVLVIYLALDGPVYLRQARRPTGGPRAPDRASIDSLATAVAGECGQTAGRPLISAGTTRPSTRAGPPAKPLKKFVVLGVPYEITATPPGNRGRHWDAVRHATRTT